MDNRAHNRSQFFNHGVRTRVSYQFSIETLNHRVENHLWKRVRKLIECKKTSLSSSCPPSPTPMRPSWTTMSLERPWAEAAVIRFSTKHRHQHSNHKHGGLFKLIIHKTRCTWINNLDLTMKKTEAARTQLQLGVATQAFGGITAQTLKKPHPSWSS